MLDMGFRPQVDRIVRRLPRNRQTMFFSATLDGAVGELAREYTNSPVRYEAEPRERGATARSSTRFVSVTADTKVKTLVEHIARTPGSRSSSSGRSAARIASCKKLHSQDVRAVAMHGDMTQSARERALARFESGKVSTLVATDVAARGLDLDDITHVINFDPPADAQGLRPPRRPNRSRGPAWQGDHARPAGAAG